MSPNQTKVLIVDNADRTRNQLTNILSDGFFVLSATSEKEAIKVVKDNIDDIFVAFININLPNQEALELVKYLKGDDISQYIFLIVVAQSSENQDLMKAIELGADDILLEPFSPAAINRRIKTISYKGRTTKSSYREDSLEAKLKAVEIDPLTGLLTQTAFDENVSEFLHKLGKTDKKYLYDRFDIDNFTLFNDSYGRDEGNRVLMTIGQVCKKYIGEGVFFGHRRADHFCAFMSKETFDKKRLVNKVIDEVTELLSEYDLRIKQGVYVVEDNRMDIESMADKAAFAIKTIRNSQETSIAIYDSSMREKLVKDRFVVEEITHAIENKELVLYYQPQVNYQTGKIVGAEALIRWMHPYKGLIMPNDFIPVLEENGLITELDKYVWNQAARSIKKWKSLGYPLVPISVNLSRKDIYNKDLKSIPDYFKNIIDENGISPDLIHVEITESSYMENPKILIKLVNDFHQFGFQVEMDDFGSAYSSLNTLKDLYVDVIKLDLKFLSNASDQARAGNILTSVVRMANWLKTPVIAEGVETKEQADFLKSIGCAHMQGFLFSRPIPEAVFVKELVNKKGYGNLDIQFNQDIKGAEEFLTPSGQSTLIFNSFLGGAAIIEYYNEQVECLRINDKFFETINLNRSDKEEVRLHLLELFDEAVGQKVIARIQDAIKDRSEQSVMVKTLPLGQNQKPAWLSLRFRLLASNEKRYILYLSAENITDTIELSVRNGELSERLTTIMDTVPGGIVDFEYSPEDKTLKLAFFNSSMNEMVGYSVKQFRSLFGNNLLRAVHPDDKEMLIKAFEESMKTNQGTINQTFRHLCSDGKFIYVNFAGRTVSRDGRLLISGIVTNINESMENEERLKKQGKLLGSQRKTLEKIYSSIPNGIIQFHVVKDVFGNYPLTYFNDVSWRLFGFENKDNFVAYAGQKGLFSLVYAADKQMFSNLVDSADSNSAHEAFYRVWVGNNNIRWHKGVVKKVTNVEGEEVIQLIFSDITGFGKKISSEYGQSLLNVYDRVASIDVQEGKVMNYFVRPEADLFGDERISNLDFFFDFAFTNVFYPEDLMKARAFLNYKEFSHRTFPDTIILRVKPKGENECQEYQITLLRGGSGSFFLICSKNVTNKRMSHINYDPSLINYGSVEAINKRNEFLATIIKQTDNTFIDYSVSEDEATVYNGDAFGRGTISQIDNYYSSDSFGRRIMPDDVKIYRSSFTRALRGDDFFTSTIRCNQKKIGFVPCLFTFSSIKDKSGQIRRIIIQVEEKKLDRDSLLIRLENVTGNKYDNHLFNRDVIRQILSFFDSETNPKNASSKASFLLGMTYKFRSIVAFLGSMVNKALTISSYWDYLGGDDDNPVGKDIPFSDEQKDELVESFQGKPYLSVSRKDKTLLGFILDSFEIDGYCLVLPNIVKGELKGIIFFNQGSKPVELDDESLKTLTITSDIFSSLAFSHKYLNLDISSPEVASAFNKLNAFSYIINSDTYEILGYNGQAIDMLGLNAKGHQCYKALGNNKMPCSNCPLAALKEFSTPIPIIVRKNERDYLVMASPVLGKSEKWVVINGFPLNDFFTGSSVNNFDNERYSSVLYNFFDELFEIDFKDDSIYLINSVYDKSDKPRLKYKYHEAITRWTNHIEDIEEKQRFIEFTKVENVRKASQGQGSSICYQFKSPSGVSVTYLTSFIHFKDDRYLLCNKTVTNTLTDFGMGAKKSFDLAIQESKDKFQAIIKQTYLSVFEYDIVTKKLTYSENYLNYKCSKYPFEDLLTKPYECQVVYNEDIPLLIKYAKNINAPGDSSTPNICELRLIMQNGTTRWTRMGNTTIRDENGKPIKYIGSFTDIEINKNRNYQLTELTNRVNHILSNIPNGVMIYLLTDKDCSLTFISEKCLSILGYSKEEGDILIANREPLDFFKSNDGGIFEFLKRNSECHKSLLVPLIKAYKKDGTTFYGRIHVKFEKNDDGSYLCFFSINNVTTDIHIQMKNSLAAEKYRILTEDSNKITFDYSPDTDSFTAAIKYPGEGLKTETFPNYTKSFMNYSRLDSESREQFVSSLIKCSAAPRESSFRIKADFFDSSFRWYQVKMVSLMGLDDVFRVVGMLDDIDDLIKRQEKLESDTDTDSLTGLFNKKYLFKKLPELISSKMPGKIDALLFSDIDDFKSINDEYGHLVGDKVLSAIGKSMLETFDSEKVLMTRFGGDEFVFYLKNLNRKEYANKVAKKFQKLLYDLKVPEVKKKIKCSVGITYVTAKKNSFAKILETADKALYKAKDSGKDSVSSAGEKKEMKK